MAIDDNTSYELTGYQVKDLAGRIRRKADASAIPTVNDATLTLVQNGTTVGTFTANQSTNTTVNLAGGVYADDPTSPANPDGWVTPSEIDWSAFSSVIQTGTITNQTFYTNTTGGQVKSFTFPTPFSNPPKVFLQTQIGSANTVTVDLASTPTTTGFEFLCRTARGANETGNVHWLAIAI